MAIRLRNHWQSLRFRPSTRVNADAELTERIRATHKASKETFGALRTRAELVDEGVLITCKRVERQMNVASIAGVTRRRGVRTTFRDNRVHPACDLVDRNFYADASGHAVGRLYHPHPDLSRVPVSGRRAGRILATHRRLDDGIPHEGPAGVRRTQHGIDPATTGQRGPSQRAGIAVHVGGIGPGQGSRRAAVDGVGRMPMTTPCARAPSRWNASCSTGARSRPRPRPAWPPSRSSRASIIPQGAIPPRLPVTRQL